MRSGDFSFWDDDLTASVVTSRSFLPPLLDLDIGFFEQQPPDLEWNSNFIFSFDYLGYGQAGGVADSS